MIYFNSVLNMTGKGTEYLIDAESNHIMAVFYDGQFQGVLERDDSQREIQTIIMAEAA